MPLFDYLCLECGKFSEILITSTEDRPQCQICGSDKVKKTLSAPSSLSGVQTSRFPGPGDTACCGANPNDAGCAGPGSCCGKLPV
jgi:putative FmdB family regulatory protein